MTQVEVFEEDGYSVDYRARALAWVMHEGILMVVVFTEWSETPWMVPNAQVRVV